MKQILYTATLALTYFSTVSGILINSPLHAAANTVEKTCELATGSATTGGAIQRQIDTITHCTNTSSNKVMDIGLTTQQSIIQPIISSEITTSPAIDENRSFCPSIPLGASADDFQYKQALARCKFGS